MKTRIQILFLLATMLFVAACNNDDDPATSGKVNLKMKAVSTESTISGGRAKATGLVFSEILLGVDELEFETDEEDEMEDNEGEDPSDEIEFEGPYVVDLINGTSTPDFGEAQVQPDLYSKIEIEMGPVLNDGSTMHIAFTYENKSVIFSTTEEIEMEIENTAGYQLTASSLTNLLVIINLDALFANIDLTTAVADNDGVIRINNDSNSELHNIILASFENSCEAGEDDDHDDEID